MVVSIHQQLPDMDLMEVGLPRPTDILVYILTPLKQPVPAPAYIKTDRTFNLTTSAAVPGYAMRNHALVVRLLDLTTKLLT